MAISIGDKIPNVQLKALINGDVKEISTQELLKDGKTVIFAVPGAFTATCSNDHLPGYVKQLDAIKSKGVNQVICLAVNDIAVLKAWAESNNATAITFLADGNAELTKLMGLDIDLSAVGMGVRSKRYTMMIERGSVAKLQIEDSPGVCQVSSAQSLLQLL
ncbi:peroxiredoxin [Candidatus Odyssella thessalonicensis]|uniref:peroxiredoxin n=1 Tax=Candidatus Odyssella thessalonicensis TaxID=84647 RepID=UPI000225B445|nr:peroxiredoxin [Candidatus Odyssella thessalonicensis]